MTGSVRKQWRAAPVPGLKSLPLREQSSRARDQRAGRRGRAGEARRTFSARPSLRYLRRGGRPDASGGTDRAEQAPRTPRLAREAAVLVAVARRRRRRSSRMSCALQRITGVHLEKRCRLRPPDSGRPRRPGSPPASWTTLHASGLGFPVKPSESPDTFSSPADVGEGARPVRSGTVVGHGHMLRTSTIDGWRRRYRADSRLRLRRSSPRCAALRNQGLSSVKRTRARPGSGRRQRHAGTHRSRCSRRLSPGPRRAGRCHWWPIVRSGSLAERLVDRPATERPRQRRARSAGPPASGGGGRPAHGAADRWPRALRPSCSLAIRGGSQTAGPYKWDSSPPNPVDRWAGLSHMRRRQ